MDSSKRIFDGTTDVKMFFFYFENVATRGKDHTEMALDLLAFLDNCLLYTSPSPRDS